MKKLILKSRKSGGNVLIVAIAILAFVVVVIGLFILSFTRLLGSHQEQRTAIEAASLAVAHDLSAIVIEDPYFGFVSLAGSPPVGKGTKAGDNYFVSVQSINSLLATIRLDMLIADQLNDDIMRSLVRADYAKAMVAKDNLVSKLRQVILPGGFGNDCNGNKIEPYQDAINAYQTNVVRMNGGKSQLVTGSMKLSLGLASGLNTSTNVPSPPGTGAVSQSQQEQGFYKAFMNVPYDNLDFVFAAMDSDTSLVDRTKFQANDASLPYVIPDVIKCEADQKFSFKDEHGNDKVATTHAVACSEPADSIDPLPNPGMFELVFTPSVPPEIGKLGDIFLYQGLQTSPSDWVQSPNGGDYPGTALKDFYPRVVNDDHPQFGKMVSLAFYDWLRRGREHIDVASLINTLNNPLSKSIAVGLPQKHQFSIEPNGTVSCVIVSDTPTTALAVSDHQYRAESGLVILSSNKKVYDAFLRDFVYQPGRINGGIHAGEPINQPLPTVAGGGMGGLLDENPANTVVFSTGPGGGDVRPTYQTKGVAVQLRLKAR